MNCGVEGVNKGYSSSDTPNTSPQDYTSFLKIVVKQWHRYYSCKIALRMMPIGKLFHIISNISYLSLVRFGIRLSIRISPLCYTNREGICCCCCCTSAEFQKRSKFFGANCAQLPILSALC